jgi:hypothetical protein
MNYAYVYVNKLQGEERSDLFGQLCKSVETLKARDASHGSIHIYRDPTDVEVFNFCKDHGCFDHSITLTRNYKDQNLLNILTEKIIQLKNFDKDQEVTLLDVDTAFIDSPPENSWSQNAAVLWKAEYYIMQFRNLDKILPLIPWAEIDIKFDESFIMYNTGVVYIPKSHRKEICEKALWITDYLNNGQFNPEDRYGSKLDEQIGLSIAIHDVFGRLGSIRTCEKIIHHFWEEKTKGIKWW